jgi:hypothetical protein
MSVLATLAVLMGCSSTNKATPPPTGGFSNTNLSGTYVFSTAGSDANGDFLTMLGTFTACGCAGGTISAGGSVVMNDPAFVFTAPVPPLTISGGTYTVGVDGRGTVTLTAPTPFQTPSIILNFVLTSTQGGLVSEFDNNGSGSGTLDLQSSVTQAQLANQTFVFNLSGVSSALGAPEATVGSVTLDPLGNATGVQDLNSDGPSNPPGAPLAIISPSTVLVGTSPGTATLFNNSQTQNFAVYAISPTHLKFIETDVSPVLAGDVFSQSSNTFPSGELAFTMAGLDYTVPGAPGPLPLAVGGMMNAAGTGISAGVEDYNDAFTSNITSSSPISSPLPFTGVVAPSGGRFLLTLNTFENGNAGAIGTFTFAAYPSTGGTQLLEVDDLGITGGVAYPQNNTSFASGQGYGLNLTGSNGGETDAIAEFTYASTNNNQNLTGLIDVNNAGAGPNAPLNFDGLYTADTTNLGRGLITTTSGGVNLISYTVDSTDSIFIEIDSYQVAVGSIGQQAAEDQGAIATRMASLRPRALARAWKKKPAAVGQGR